VLLGYSVGGFGGGLGDDLSNVNDRDDFDALLVWGVRNLGMGEAAARRETSSRREQASYEKLRMMDEVAREIAEAHSQTTHRARQVSITEQAIQSAENSYDRNVSRIRESIGLPIEALQSVRALEEARRAYLSSVIGYNEAQFRLQWALGWPASGSPDSESM
jgi:outer membrane protein TolC